MESAEGLMCPGVHQGWRSPTPGVLCLTQKLTKGCVDVLAQDRAVSMGIQGLLENGVCASTE